jgi:hypothetical protein
MAALRWLHSTREEKTCVWGRRRREGRCAGGAYAEEGRGRRGGRCVWGQRTQSRGANAEEEGWDADAGEEGAACGGGGHRGGAQTPRRGADAGEGAACGGSGRRGGTRTPRKRVEPRRHLARAARPCRGRVPAQWSRPRRSGALVGAALSRLGHARAVAAPGWSCPCRDARSRLALGARASTGLRSRRGRRARARAVRGWGHVGAEAAAPEPSWPPRASRGHGRAPMLRPGLWRPKVRGGKVRREQDEVMVACRGCSSSLAEGWRWLGGGRPPPGGKDEPPGGGGWS